MVKQFFFLRCLADAHCLRTTYKDNRFLDRHYKRVLEGIRDPNLRKIYLEGLWGTIQNIIYQPYEIMEAFPKSFDETIYGLDFGFNNPTALLEINIKDMEYYLREKIYRTEMTNSDLISHMKRIGIPRNRNIYADSAEPNRIEEIRRAGFRVFSARKDVSDGIDVCQRMKYYSLPENVNLNKERQNYKWREDKDGKPLDEPEKFNDHLMDTKRYGVFSHLKKGARILGGVSSF